MGAGSNSKPVSHQENLTRNEDVFDKPTEYAEGQSRPEEKIFEPQKVQEVKKEHVPTIEKTEKQPQVNIQEVKSPVLKKLLEELREHKERG